MNMQCTLKFLKHSLRVLLLKNYGNLAGSLCTTVCLYVACTPIAMSVLGLNFEVPAAIVLPQNSLKIFSFEVRIWCRYKTTNSNLTNLPFTYTVMMNIILRELIIK